MGYGKPGAVQFDPLSGPWRAVRDLALLVGAGIVMAASAATWGEAITKRRKKLHRSDVPNAASVML